jgi:hypothetical protein
MLYQVLYKEPVPPSQLIDRCPCDLETICLKCLQKEPAKRYATALELAEDLGRFQRGEPIVARPVGRLERGWRWCRRNPAVAALFISLFVVLTAGVVTSTLFGLRADAKAEEARTAAGRAEEKTEVANREALAARTAERLARQREYDATLVLTQMAWEQNEVRLVVDRLEGQKPGPDEEDRRGFEWYYWQALLRRGHVTLKGHTLPVSSVAFSPNGKRLATASADKTVKVWDAETGQETLTLKGHTNAVSSVAFSPDGKQIVSASWDRTLIVWDASLGDSRGDEAGAAPGR